MFIEYLRVFRPVRRTGVSDFHPILFLIGQLRISYFNQSSRKTAEVGVPGNWIWE